MSSNPTRSVFHRHAPAGLHVNAGLQLFDVLTTAVILLAGGIEANPFSAMIMAKWGFGAWVAIKLVLAAAFLAVLPAVRRAEAKDRRQAGIMAAVFAALMFLVVLNNSLMIGVYVVG